MKAEMPPSPEPIESLLEAALSLPRDERDAFLKSACEGDPKLEEELRSLLAAHEVIPPEFLLSEEFPGKEPPGDLDLTIPFESATDRGRTRALETPGDWIGRYKLLQTIGEGGFGTVWMAEQTEPVLRRVALKVIKMGMDTREVIARFEAERQALAMMSHPNIAQVFDGGATERGRPYFVMELVRGIPITQYCDEAKLGTRERLDLFADVCAAINHAHQKGVIHRDIKPSNVLVTLHGEKPVVKVIDFGIAKATHSKLTDKTLFTRFEQVVGTPVYMSPEQAGFSGQDLDTRSDIYALGVLLYELLTGRPPFDSKSLVSAGYDEMRRIICEEDPPRPSVRLHTLVGEERTSVARARHVEPGMVNRLVDPDLDWIVMKAIEKDRGRRYETANALSRDLERYLTDEPVEAAAPSAAYRMRKFARRHRVGMRVAAGITLILVAASIVCANLAVREFRARKEAESQRKSAQSEALRASEAELREADMRLEADRRAYAADMSLAQLALESHNLRQARQLLDRHRPEEGAIDLRGQEWRWLWSRCQSDALYELGRGDRRVLQAVFVNNGRDVVTYEDGGAIREWNLEGRSVNVLLDEQTPGLSLVSNSGYLCFSKDQRWMGAVGMDGDRYVVRIWDRQTEAEPLIVDLGDQRATGIDISPDGKTLAAFLVKQDMVAIWNLESGERDPWRVQLEKANEKMNMRYYGAVRFSADGGTLAVGGAKGQVKIVDVASRSVRANNLEAGGRVSSLEFTPDGRFLACGSTYSDPRVVVWNVESGETAVTLFGHEGFIPDVAFSPDGSLLASASGDQTIKVWRTGDWEECETLLGHTDEVWSVAFSPDGTRLISGGKDRSIQVWPVRTTVERGGWSLLTGQNPSYLDVSPDGKRNVRIQDGRIVLDGDPDRVPRELDGNHRAVFWVSADEILACADSPPAIRLWNVTTGTIESFPGGGREGAALFMYLPATGTLVELLENEKMPQAAAVRWDVANRTQLSSSQIEVKKLKEFFGSKASDSDLRALLSRDGSRLVISKGLNALEVIDLVSGKSIASFDAKGTEGIQGLALSPDGRQVAVATRNRAEFQIWDVDSQRQLNTVPGHNLVILNLVYSPDGTRLISSTIGSEPPKVWDTLTWREVCRFRPPKDVFLFRPWFLSDGNTVSTIAYHFNGKKADVVVWKAPALNMIEDAEMDGPWK